MCNLPPGVRVSDIPGNRPEDYAADERVEFESKVYQTILQYYSPEDAKIMRKALLEINPDNIPILDAIELDVKIESIKEQISELRMYQRIMKVDVSADIAKLEEELNVLET